MHSSSGTRRIAIALWLALGVLAGAIAASAVRLSVAIWAPQNVVAATRWIVFGLKIALPVAGGMVAWRRVRSSDAEARTLVELAFASLGAGIAGLLLSAYTWQHVIPFGDAREDLVRRLGANPNREVYVGGNFAGKPVRFVGTVSDQVATLLFGTAGFFACRRVRGRARARRTQRADAPPR